MCSLVRKCGFQSLPQLSSCVLWFLHTVDFCQKEPWSVHKYLGTNSTVGLFCYLSLHILKLWCEDIWLDLPTLCSFHLLFQPNTVLCIADLTHVQIGPARKGGRKRERRKEKRERHRDCVSVLERKFLSLWIFFFPRKSTFSFTARLPTFMWIRTTGSPDTWNKNYISSMIGNYFLK